MFLGFGSRSLYLTAFDNAANHSYGAPRRDQQQRARRLGCDVGRHGGLPGRSASRGDLAEPVTRRGFLYVLSWRRVLVVLLTEQPAVYVQPAKKVVPGELQYMMKKAPPER